MLIRKIVTGFVVISFSAASHAQGYFDFGEIPGVDDQPLVDVNLNAVMIGFLGTMAREVDPAAADLLSGLRGVRVRVFDSVRNERQISNFIDEVTETLEEQGWQRVVFVQEETAKARIHMQMTEDEVSGMTVMLFDGSEVVLINIAGNVSAADLGRIMAALPVDDVLGSMPFPPPPASVPAD